MRVELNLKRMQKKAEAHAYLAEQFEFPEYYGRNLDALYDALSEKLSAEPYEIIIAGEGIEETDEWGYAAGVIRVLRDLERRWPEGITVRM